MVLLFSVSLCIFHGAFHLQNLSGKEYLKKLVSSRESVEGLAPPDDALISSVKGAFAEASLPALSFQRVAYEEMRDRNSVVLAQLEALGGYEVTSP